LLYGSSRSAGPVDGEQFNRHAHTHTHILPVGCDASCSARCVLSVHGFPPTGWIGWVFCEMSFFSRHPLIACRYEDWIDVVDRLRRSNHMTIKESIMRYAQPNGSALQKILQPARRGLEVIEFLGLPLSGKVSAPLGFSRSLVFENKPMRERWCIFFSCQPSKHTYQRNS
jgi:hypothetical protein